MWNGSLLRPGLKWKQLIRISTNTGLSPSSNELYTIDPFEEMMEFVLVDVDSSKIWSIPSDLIEVQTNVKESSRNPMRCGDGSGYILYILTVSIKSNPALFQRFELYPRIDKNLKIHPRRCNDPDEGFWMAPTSLRVRKNPARCLRISIQLPQFITESMTCNWCDR